MDHKTSSPSQGCKVLPVVGSGSECPTPPTTTAGQSLATITDDLAGRQRTSSTAASPRWAPPVCGFRCHCMLWRLLLKGLQCPPALQGSLQLVQFWLVEILVVHSKQAGGIFFPVIGEKRRNFLGPRKLAKNAHFSPFLGFFFQQNQPKKHQEPIPPRQSAGENYFPSQETPGPPQLGLLGGSVGHWLPCECLVDLSTIGLRAAPSTGILLTTNAATHSLMERDIVARLSLLCAF